MAQILFDLCNSIRWGYLKRPIHHGLTTFCSIVVISVIVNNDINYGYLLIIYLKQYTEWITINTK